MKKLSFQNYTFGRMKLIIAALALAASLLSQNNGIVASFVPDNAVWGHCQKSVSVLFLQTGQDTGDSATTDQTEDLKENNDQKDTYGPDKGHNMVLLISVLLGLVLIPIFVFRKMR